MSITPPHLKTLEEVACGRIMEARGAPDILISKSPDGGYPEEPNNNEIKARLISCGYTYLLGLSW
jgi:hypothetical protein